MNNRKALVTGSTSGIGYAIAQKFLEEGAQVITTGRSAKGPVFDQVDPNKSHYLSADLKDFSNIDNLLKFTFNKFSGPPDIAVINAGIGLAGTLLTSDWTKWNELFDLNCKSTFYQLKIIAAAMLKCHDTDEAYKKEQKDIVILSSIVGRNISEANPVYGATKFALTSAAESLRKEICHTSIRVTVIEPGFVRSNFQERAGYDLAAFQDLEEKFGPFLTPEDIASQVLFVVQQPKHINISNLIIRPSRQKP